MKIYFAGSIRAGRGDRDLYLRLIEHLGTFGTVLTEHVGADSINDLDETISDDAQIYNRDMAWLHEADVIIAEVSTPSLGVGYEIRSAEQLQKPMLYLYKQDEGRKLSAMIAGIPGVKIARYATLEEAKKHIDHFMDTKH